MASEDEFRPVPGVPGLSVSADGRVRRDATGELVPGYKSNLVRVRSNGRRYVMSVPRVVSEVWPEERDDSRFKTIPGFSGYEIDDRGAVWSATARKYLVAAENADGYMFVKMINDEGKRVNKRIHRLVMAAHHPEEYSEDLTVDHVDRDKSNNHVDNLRMATPRQQMSNRGESRPTTGNSAPVFRRLPDGATERYESLKAAARATGVPSTVICRKARGPSPREWEYAHVAEPEPDLPGEAWKSVAEAGVATTRRMVVQLSDRGRVRRWNNDFLQPVRTARDLHQKNGYPVIQIASKTYYLHVLVARLFVSQDDLAKTIVNHKDGDKLNAAAENLEWVTQSENRLHAHATGLIKKRKIA